MKKHLLIASLFSLFLLITSDVSAQKKMAHDPSAHKVLVDNEILSAIEITFPPGKRTDIHTHPAHFVYALTDGKLEVTTETGEVITFELKAGESMYSEPQGLHSTVNTGKSDVKILLIELNEHPYKMDKSKKSK